VDDGASTVVLVTMTGPTAASVGVSVTIGMTEVGTARGEFVVVVVCVLVVAGELLVLLVLLLVVVVLALALVLVVDEAVVESGS
jgi:hypothetical protein